MRECVVLQPAMAAYRQGFLDRLSDTEHLVFLVGDSHFVPSVKTDVSSPLVESTGENRFIVGRRFGWQRRVWSRALRADVLVAELNPRNLNTWALLLARKALRRRTILWGHAWPRTGERSWSDVLRGLLRRSSDGLLVYTEDQAQSLKARMKRHPIFVAPNALYGREELYGLAKPTAVQTTFLWIGRIVPEKRLDLALRALASYNARVDFVARLVVIGDGPEREQMQSLTEQLGLKDSVCFEGWHNGVGFLRENFHAATALISSGYVGLNATQSLGFGCPVIWSPSILNSPEVSLLNETNSIEFIDGDVESLAQAMHQSVDRSFDRQNISKETSRVYSVDAMAEGFLSCLS